MDDTVRFIPLGGVGDVTRNMYVYEYENEILLVDCGIGFPSEDMLGVDLLIPDISYLLDKKEKIRGLVLTHGHEDHIGALPYILPSLGKFPLFATKLTAGLANAKLAEFGLGTPIKTIPYKEVVNIGPFRISLIHVSHSIPDAANIHIETPIGSFFHASDFKFDQTPVDGAPTDILSIAEIGRKGTVCLFSDCLRAEEKGVTPSERTIEEALSQEVQKCVGKFIMTTYSSNISRLQQAVNVAMRFNRKVCFVGRSMVQAKEVAVKLGFLSVPQGMEVPLEQIKQYKDKDLLLLVAGSQGQENSAMTRMAEGSNKFVSVKDGDTVVFSADPIPGNENAVNELIDALSRKGVYVIYSDINDSFHVSGHGAANDLMLMMQLTNSKFLLPIGGTYKQMIQYRKLAENMGYKRGDVFLVQDGDVLEFTKESAKIVSKIPIRNVYVDDMEGTEVHSAILRDRQKLAEDGILVIIVQVDREGNIFGDIDVISRGFADFSKNKDLLGSIQGEVRNAIGKDKKEIREWHFERKRIENGVEKLIFKKMRRRPLILPLLVEV
jgi:ribonuclease J